MQFNSFVFILLFLPLTVITYFLLNKIRPIMGKFVIIVASIVFYSYSDWKLFSILLFSIIVNLVFVYLIWKFEYFKRIFLVVPVVVNIGMLLGFKYINFFIGIFNSYVVNTLPTVNIIQPLGISFFTFQQIAYLVAVYNKEIDKISILDYLSYILYFPKILMGPLMEPGDFVNQINDGNLKKINLDNIASGIKIFSLGLFKKVMIADVFAKGVNWGFSNFDSATSMDWILITLFYTFEIYFDFSGYSDMAVGASQMLNIVLPINFDSPYKALSVRDFWKRWHISLTQFFTKYVYIPLGGNRKGRILTYVNIMIVFGISGLWHGANYTFILWGILNGALMIFDRIFSKFEKAVFEPVRWGGTFCIINVLWLLFRSQSISQWKSIIKTIMKMQNTMISSGLIKCFSLPEASFLTNIFHLSRVNGIRGFWLITYVVFAMGICLVPENNYRNRNRLSIETMFLTAIAFVWGFICLSSESVFVYFNF